VNKGIESLPQTLIF